MAGVLTSSTCRQEFDKMKKVEPIILKKTGVDLFQTATNYNKPPDLKINIFSADRRNWQEKRVTPYKVVFTRNDEISEISEILLPTGKKSKNNKKCQKSVKKPDEAGFPEKPVKKNDEAVIKKTPKRNRKANGWRWIYIKLLEPSKRLSISVHRFPEQEPIKKFKEDRDSCIDLPIALGEMAREKF